MRKFLLLVLAIAFTAPSALAQWQSVGAFPADDPFFSSMHGVAVDAEGKVWLTPFSATETIVTAQGDTVNTNAIYVLNPDGTPADFSPIQTITVGEETDTLFINSRGLHSDIDGNILHATGDGRLYRINHETGEGMDVIVPQATSLTQPAVDNNGNIYVALVLQNTGPLRIYDPELNFIENAIDTTRGFSRSFEVTGDGNAIYWGGFTNDGIWKYTRPDEFSPFEAVPDTLFPGITAESFARHPITDNIWISAGPSGAGSATGGFSDYTWYEIDPETDTVLDSLKWDTSAGIAAEKPRGMAFAPDGMTAYAVMFDANSGAPSVQKFVKSGDTAIEKVADGVPQSFTLKQNYPNPFNPSTRIEFELHKSSQATLKVYNVLGREVAVLVDAPLSAGTYAYTFDAADLPSGTYMYTLTAGGERQSSTMILAK